MNEPVSPIVEELDGESVELVGEPRPSAVLERRDPAAVAQAAVVLAGGFVAGAATMLIVRRHSAGPSRRRRARRRGRPEVLASNSFLIDVHLLRRD